MGFDEGRVTLDRESGEYTAGETVHGLLEFQQDKPKTFRGIYVKARGYAHTHWTTSHTRRGADGKSHTYHVSHDGNEDYFSSTQYLVGSDSGEHHLQPGFHKLPFQIPVPSNCPSSFEGDYGHVRYELTIVVDRAFKFDQEKAIGFTVMAPVDLNADPSLRAPVCMETEEAYCCWCMSSGDVLTSVRFPASGFTPGQRVAIELACENRSSVAMNKVKMAIKQDSRFIAHSAPGTRDGNRRSLVEVKKGPIPAKTSRAWTLELEVPLDTQPSGLTNCHIIDMGYVFKMTVVAEGCHSNAEREYPLCIGTVPLRDAAAAAQYDQADGRDTAPLLSQHAPQHNAHFPNSYHNTNPPYPSHNEWGSFPGASPSNQSYPSAGSPYPGAGAPYPGAGAPYPGAGAPYPGAGSPYSGAGTPYPVAGVPYPSANRPYDASGGSPYGPTSYPPPAPSHSPYPNKKEQEANASSYPNAPPPPPAVISNPPPYASVAHLQPPHDPPPPPVPMPPVPAVTPSAPPPLLLPTDKEPEKREQ